MTAEQLAKLESLNRRWVKGLPNGVEEESCAIDVMALLPDVLDHIKQLTAERDAAQTACAELRHLAYEAKRVLAYVAYHRLPLGNTVMDTLPEHWQKEVSIALDIITDDHGKDYVPKSELEAAQKACAEMRDAIGIGLPMLADALQNLNGYKDWAARIRRISKSAHSISCGKGYHHDDEWKPVVEALESVLPDAEDYPNSTVVKIKQALAHAEKLMEGK